MSGRILAILLIGCPEAEVLDVEKNDLPESLVDKILYTFNPGDVVISFLVRVGH